MGVLSAINFVLYRQEVRPYSFHSMPFPAHLICHQRSLCQRRQSDRHGLFSLPPRSSSAEKTVALPLS